MQANKDSGADVPGNGDNAMAHLETLLLLSDDENDRDLDLALNIINELDISLLESESPANNSSSSGNPDELRMLQALYQDDISSGSDYSNFSFSTESFASTPAANLASPAQAKRKEKKCTYQNRREEIQILRDEVVTLESQVRKLKQVRTRRRQTAAGERNQHAKNASLAGIEKENAELKAAILAQKAQLNNLLENMQASKLIVTTRPSDRESEPDLN